MRIVSVGTFLLPVRFSLTDLVKGGRKSLADALYREFAEFGQSTAVGESELLFDFHRNTGAQQMETMVFSGSTRIEGVGMVQLYVSCLATAFVVVEMELPDDTVVDLEATSSRESFKSYETPLSHAVAPLIAQWCARVAQAAPSALVRPRPASAMEAGRLLWWHRISLNPLPGTEFPAAHWYGVTTELADAATVQVGNGFTNVYGDAQHLIDDVVEGLMVATQEWIVVDEAKRLISDHLVRLSRSRGESMMTVDAQYLEVLELTEEVTLRNLVLGEEAQYLTNARMKVKQAAEEAWRLGYETQKLEERTTALRDLFSLHRERIFNNRDDRRNRLVFVFTAVTLVQSVLVWYDFLTNDFNTVAGEPRPVIAYVVLALTLATVVGAVAGRLFTRSRKVRPRPPIPKQRNSSEQLVSS